MPRAELLDFVRSVYGFVKLVNFNEADALSIYEVLAAKEARDGRVLHQREFEAALTVLVREFPALLRPSAEVTHTRQLYGSAGVAAQPVKIHGSGVSPQLQHDKVM